MALRFIRKLIIVFFILAIIAPFGCKKNSTAPQVDSLTRPVIWLNTFEMSFAAVKSEGNPEPQILQIKNTGIDTLSYDITCEADWLEVEPMTGSSSGQVNGHEISARKTGLEVREEPYTTTIKITDPNCYNNPQEVKVSMPVSKEPPPTIGVSPKNLEFSAQQEGSDPPPQTIEIVNTGKGTLKYEIESDANWLNVSPDTGSSKTATKKHTVSCSTGGLKVGTHTGTLKIRDPDATNSPQTVKVSFNVTKEPLPEIWTSTKTISMEAFQGGSSPSSVFYVKNSGGGTLNYAVDRDKPWMSVSPNGGTSSGQERKHTVRTGISSLGVGTHRGTITITDNKASNSPQYIDVILTIESEPPPPEPNKIWADLNPGSASPGTTISVKITISGNQNVINSFGLDLNFDPNMFDYVGTSNGSLTGGGWSVGGNQISPGTIRVGGFGGSSSIPVGSKGTIAVVQLRVTGSNYGNGTPSQISISNYIDGIAGMKPEPANSTFTLQK